MEEQNIGYLIKAISERMKAIGDNELREHDLTFSQMQVISVIESHGGRMARKDIEKILDVSHPTMVGLIHRLEDKGFVICEENDDPRRIVIVSLSEKAEQLKKTVREAHEQRNRELLEGFSEEEIGQIYALLLKLYSNLSEERKV